MSEVTRLHPLWKNAVEIAAEDFSYGDLITFDWLHDHFGIEKPTTGTFDSYQSYQFDFLASLDGFRRELLETHKMATENIRGRGYRVIEPKEQTGFAEKQLSNEMKRSIRKAFSVLTNIAIDAIDDSERKRNVDAIGRVAAIHALTKNRRKIGFNENAGSAT